MNQYDLCPDEASYRFYILGINGRAFVTFTDREGWETRAE